MYSMSWASLLAQDSSRVTRVWAKPVPPGRTTRRCQSSGCRGRARRRRRADRPRADNCHVAAQDVPELRHLVEAGGPQGAADHGALFLGPPRKLLAEQGPRRLRRRASGCGTCTSRRGARRGRRGRPGRDGAPGSEQDRQRTSLPEAARGRAEPRPRWARRARAGRRRQAPSFARRGVRDELLQGLFAEPGVA